VGLGVGGEEGREGGREGGRKGGREGGREEQCRWGGLGRVGWDVGTPYLFTPTTASSLRILISANGALHPIQ
jgi:hypothetical protein